MRITAVADEETCAWLKLSGIGTVHPIQRPDQGGKILQMLTKEKDIAVIIVTPDVVEANEEIVRESMDQVFPVIIELPTKEKKSDPLRDLIRFAVGIELEI